MIQGRMDHCWYTLKKMKLDKKFRDETNQALHGVALLSIYILEADCNTKFQKENTLRNSTIHKYGLVLAIIA